MRGDLITLTPTYLPVRGAPGKPQPVSERCVVPGCSERSRHGHHVYPRSHLRGQPYDWVTLPDGATMSNLVGLCVPHHADVTGGVGGHAARIDHGEGVWWWIEIRSVGDAMVNHVIGPLVQQPLVVEGDPSNLTEHPARSHTSLAPGETCPSCGYTKPAARTPGPRRAAGSWTVAVPQDAELGAEVLDDWVKDFAALLGLDPASPRLLRYHVLTTVLAWAAQNQAQFVYDVRESRLA